LQELGRLDEDSTVYKQIGPAMIKQDLVEAQTNVSKRLEFIQVWLKAKQQTLLLCSTM
jgi:prefoldin beta subunit